NEAKRHLKKFEEDPEIEIMNGRYGPYIAYKGSNYRIPKTMTNPEALTLTECQEIIAKENERRAKKEPAVEEAATKTSRGRKKK
ncbi:MAG: DNA topoisomerase I, partial [Bacteroidaceae bacterium]|nr:DNA topoisomerase I [Bacteroidaceae bacterium]